ncbi:MULTISPECIES: RNA 2'-phosphotransferase [Streptococcus]|uniref:RNA 2'-phosphotransferase n=1 Tax=Streptococcus TaxID=1301 RepID=UPI000F90BE81|nr:MULTISPECIES: RNA 2'-phosphotransferase [Streptococcus]MCB6406212.1 RNA 2'-phosphotransferase [Streptococcus gordonii]MDN5021255.1 RNA 2'-phosphotransferase [Streptococcus sp. SG2]RSJ33652.1 RNA 2'-phosphotransferase [Streptococcus gordonii]RSJ34495.1 RNA 2'-phosphotransferase [Streptococcus gordonii]
MFDYQKLSREISYILRHNPQKYNLTLDKEGWAVINDLLQKLNARSEWNGLSKKDLEKMIASSNKKRHEIQSDKIRAFYGHSLKEKVQKNPFQPPKVPNKQLLLM